VTMSSWRVSLLVCMEDTGEGQSWVDFEHLVSMRFCLTTARARFLPKRKSQLLRRGLPGQRTVERQVSSGARHPLAKVLDCEGDEQH
jgi:hypothetical protein